MRSGLCMLRKCVMITALSPALSTMPRTLGQERDDAVLVEKLTAIILDEDADGDDKSFARQEISKLPEAFRNRAWAQIVSQGRSDHAFIAACALVQTGAVDSMEIVAAAFPKLALNQQFTILSRIRYAPNPAKLLSLPRSILGKLVLEGARLDATPLPDYSGGIDIAGISAQLLKGGNDPQDIQLVEKSVEVSPKSMYAWFAVASLQNVSDGTYQLATQVMNDSAFPERARVPAAVVVGKMDPSGNDFVSRFVRDFVNKYSSRSVEELRSEGGPNNYLSKGYLLFHEEMHLLFSALLVPEDFVKDSLFKAIGGRNNDLKRISVVIVARRWPDRLLDMMRRREFKEEENAVAVALVTLHPSMRESVEGVMDRDLLRVKLQEFKETGQWLDMRAPDLSVFDFLDSQVNAE